MTPSLHQFYLARITLQTVTPLSIAAGGADGVFDLQLVRDANGLPTLPGSSIAGVLRHLYWELHGQEAMTEVFGYQDGDQGSASRLQVTWGAIQDSKGKPVEGLLLGATGAKRMQDPVLAAVVEGADRETRDRVRIGHKGAAADTGKFDRVVLPAGHRFSAELSLWSSEANDPRWDNVLALLTHPLFRLGGGTRSGLGRLAVVSVHQRAFDLREDADRRAFSATPRGLGATTGLAPYSDAMPANSGFVAAKLTLKPRAFWRIGEGEGGEGHLVEGDKPADLLPKLESRWDWDAKAPKAVELLIPGSSLKGLLAHRVAFHAHRHARQWADSMLKRNPDYDKSLHCDAVRELFGFARDDKSTDKDEPRGRAGRVFIDDGYLELTEDQLKIMMHNAIDRFTGGVREHMLFSEELVWKGAIGIDLMIDTRAISDPSRRALREALADLCAGRIAIGGGAGKGHGFCDGSIEWSDDGRWIDAPDAGSRTESTRQEAA